MSSARTPNGQALRDRRALQRRGRRRRRSSGARRGGRRPRAARRRRWDCRGRRATRPSRRRADGRLAGCGRSPTTSSPGRMPCSSPSGISSVRPSRKPTTSARSALAARRRRCRQSSPTSASGPSRLDDEADDLGDAAVEAVRVGAPQPLRRRPRARPAVSVIRHRSPSMASRRRSSWESSVASTSPASVRTTTPPRCTRRSPMSSRCCSVPDLGRERVLAVLDQLQVGGVADDRSAGRARTPCAARPRSTLSDALGLRLERRP